MYLKVKSAAIALLMFSVMTAFGQTELAGKWIIDIPQSDFGSLTPDQGAAKSIAITLAKDSVRFERDFVTSGLSIEVLPLSGDSVRRDLSRPGAKIIKTTSLKWDAKAGKLVVGAVYDMDDQAGKWQYTRTETYSVSKDGKTLTLDRVCVLPDRTETVKAVYTKAR